MLKVGAPLFHRASMIPSVFIFFVLPLSALAGLGADRLSRDRPPIPLILTLLVFAEGLGASRGWIPWTRFTRLASFDGTREMSDFPHLDAVTDPSGQAVYRIECRTPQYAMICPDYALAPRGLRLINGDRYHFPGEDARHLAMATGPARSLLDVRYVLAPEPLDDSGLRLRETVWWTNQASHEEGALRDATREFERTRGKPWDGRVYVYEAGPHPHAFPVDRDSKGEGVPDHPVTFEVTSLTPTRIELSWHAPRSGILFVSELFDAGWTADVDGLPADIVRLDGGYLGVSLDGGVHVVRLRYDPASFDLGLGTSALTLVVLLLVAAGSRRRAGIVLKEGRVKPGPTALGPR